VLPVTQWDVREGDCLSVMAAMPPNSVDLIVADPPYFRVKNEPWDRQWAKPEGFLAWMGEVAEQWHRILKPNGSLYCFASPQMGARVEVQLRERFEIVNHITWAKPPFSTKAEMFDKPTMRGYFPASERIIFAEHYGADNIAKGEAGYAAKCDELRGFVFEPLRAYLEAERLAAGLTREDVRAGFAERLGTLGKISGHYYDRAQWMLPTSEHYEWLRQIHNGTGGDYLKREYDDLKRECDDLKREYDDLRQEFEALRRPFAVTADVPYTDVWTFPTVGTYAGKHPCEKPQAMLRHIIAASSRPDALVLDPFAGSGSTGEAALALGRRFLGIEMSPHWVAKARERCATGVAPSLFDA
jgi:site-specific DNA-methyltransferase (adenine-specific)